MTDCCGFAILVVADLLPSTGFKMNFLVKWPAGRISKFIMWPFFVIRIFSSLVNSYLFDACFYRTGLRSIACFFLHTCAVAAHLTKKFIRKPVEGSRSVPTTIPTATVSHGLTRWGIWKLSPYSSKWCIVLQMDSFNLRAIIFLFLFNDKKCINKEERVRHLPGYCPWTSQENKDAEERWIT